RPKVRSHFSRECLAHVLLSWRRGDHDVDVVECLTAGFAVDRLTLADIRIVRVENEAGDPDKRPFAYIVTGDRNKVCQLRAVRFFPELLVASGSLRID